MFADANSYWCNGTEWPDCPPDTCQCRKMAFEAARAAIAAMNDVEPELLFKPRPMTSFIASLPKDKLAKLKNYSGSENHGEAQPLLPCANSDGGIVHELRGAPRDLWLVLMAAALMNTEPQAPSSE
jgi:hypothetical protein